MLKLHKDDASIEWAAVSERSVSKRSENFGSATEIGPQALVENDFHTPVPKLLINAYVLYDHWK